MQLVYILLYLLKDFRMLPPVLEIYVVWHPEDTAGASISQEFLDHFHGTSGQPPF